jgi:hypothetical protein
MNALKGGPKVAHVVSIVFLFHMQIFDVLGMQIGHFKVGGKKNI